MLKSVSVLTSFALLLAATATLASSCGSGPVINVYNWGDYIDDSVLKAFTEETGIRVNYSTYARNEEMYEKVKRGNSGYDIVVPSDFMASKMIKEGLLEKLDFSAIPNFSNIDGRFTSLSYDPSDEYSVPYMWGTTGILYNTTMVDETVDSWDILWDARYSGQIFMYESMRDIFAVAQKRLGFSINDTDINNLNAAKMSLSEQKPLVQAYLDESIKDKMIGREGALAAVFSGDAFYCIEENDELAYIVPKEGSNVWYDVLVIPKGSKRKQEAQQFIDYMCRPDVALKNTLYVGYSTPNKEAYKLLDEDWQGSDVYWPDDDVLDRCEVMVDLGAFTQEYDRAWTEVLASR
ncbi:MAG: spermidine/putrescine ABC transporter substrate-binding protein [Oscillospiraceae bacterium]|jgi:spermidine/putrescine transport system substrate-binding protein|nr:spermidine/putrescine ABC transporter substrate-binding protein [Oscillospiraceae bacterium]